MDDIEETGFPMAPKLIARYQKTARTLKSRKKKHKDHYTKGKLKDVDLIYYKSKIYVPKPLTDRIVAWMHEYLAHP